MIDVHQPDEGDRARAEAEAPAPTVADQPTDELRRRAVAAGVEGAEEMDRAGLVAAVGGTPPSSRRDPSAPDAPRT